jgi:peptide/nickel transport system substrate-binding protein/oligopeptide transport system substrate-binding protein
LRVHWQVKLLSLLFLILSSAFSGCGGTARNSDELHLILEHDLPTLDPALSTSTNSGKLVALIFSNLVIYGENGKVVPELAKSWTISDDGRTYTFKLKENGMFSNGKKVTAEDFKYSIERVMSPTSKSPRKWVFDRIKGSQAFSKGEAQSIKGIKVEGEHTISLTLEKPFAPFLGFLTMPAAAVVEKTSVEKAGETFGREPVGSGPYILESWTMGSQIVLARNPLSNLKPVLNKIVYTIINEPFTYSTEFKVGNLDMIPLPYSEVEYFTNHKVWKESLKTQPGLNTYFVGMNCQKKPCSDTRVRQAICHAIQFDLIVNTTRKDQAIRAFGPIPPGIPGHSKDFRGISYDLKKAKELLKEAGYEKGMTLELLQDQRNENLEVTQLVVSSLADIGIKVNIIPMEWGVYTSRVNEGKFDLYYRSWLADYMDAENFLFPLFHSSQAGSAGNRPRYSNPEVDRLIELAQATVDDTERLKLYRRIEEIVVNEGAYAFLFHKLERIVTQPWVKNFKLKPVFNSYKFDTLSLDKDLLKKGVK